MIVQIVFWILVSAVVYNYLGYPLLLMLLAGAKRMVRRGQCPGWTEWPEVTLMVPAYNEIEYIQDKLNNTRKLDYPKDKLKVIWVTDGSNDGSPERLQKENGIIVLHQNQRSGKIGAVNRAMQLVKTPFVVFCDANSMLNAQCLKEILSPFTHPVVGCVAGEKRIVQGKNEQGVGQGEGLYWNYESLIKKLESEVNTTIGAAGELFALRTALFETIPGDSVIEDFVIALGVIKKGFKVKYAPGAISEETASASISEELKRKVRIAYGSIQAFLRNLDMLNIFKYGFTAFEYFSHKVLRWTVVPLSIPVIFLANLIVVYQPVHPGVFDLLLLLQFVFYALAFIGWVFQGKKMALALFIVPFYLLVMNYAIVRGYFRYLGKGQSVAWEKARRA
jgi:cellulose synthase/poly-beta-1,6-N-acetylglucosamine synthase-like glycosyltransferase